MPALVKRLKRLRSSRFAQARARTRCGLLTVLLLVNCTGLAAADKPNGVVFKPGKGRLEILVRGRPFAVYVYRDKKIQRPYFTAVTAQNGQQVTRHHPPRPGVDSTDHDTMHPGIHLAFGDLGGSDFWRNRGRVVHVRFVELPWSGARQGSFAVVNRYQVGSRIVCREVCRHRVMIRPHGIMLTYESKFSSESSDFAFGDQEEMGLGVRVDRELRVKGGRGSIIDSEGRRNEKNVWGRQALWCGYSGVKDGQHIGLALMPDPGNFRKSWFHARDYGFLLANPFGRKAFTRGKPSRVNVPKGTVFQLKYGVLVHGTPADEPVDLKAAYADFLSLIGRK